MQSSHFQLLAGPFAYTLLLTPSVACPPVYLRSHSRHYRSSAPPPPLPLPPPWFPAADGFHPSCRYKVDGFLEKNRDLLRDELKTLVASSSSPFISQLLRARDITAEGSKGGKGASNRRPTVAATFSQSLLELITTMSACYPYFVRCIKPNERKAPADFELPMVLDQLRYSGMLETIRIRRAGFPVRIPFAEFSYRFRALSAGARAGQRCGLCGGVARAEKASTPPPCTAMQAPRHGAQALCTWYSSHAPSHTWPPCCTALHRPEQSPHPACCPSHRAGWRQHREGQV